VPTNAGHLRCSVLNCCPGKNKAVLALGQGLALAGSAEQERQVQGVGRPAHHKLLLSGEEWHWRAPASRALEQAMPRG
jgi:hypothetical protein